MTDLKGTPDADASMQNVDKSFREYDKGMGS